MSFRRSECVLELRTELEQNPATQQLSLKLQQQRGSPRECRELLYVAGMRSGGADDGGTGKHCRVLEHSQVDG